MTFCWCLCSLTHILPRWPALPHRRYTLPWSLALSSNQGSSVLYAVLLWWRSSLAICFMKGQGKLGDWGAQSIDTAIEMDCSL